MRTGRPRKPTKLKLIQGTLRPGRDLPNEAIPAVEIPPMPAHLSPDAQVEWNRICKHLSQLGLLTMIDRSMLAAYCQNWSRWVFAEQQIEKLGPVIKAPSGYPILNPFVAIANKALELMHKFGTEFGLSPASRTRISVDASHQTDPMEIFLFGQKN
jgi:P27 family predicted phage terminase small subunit